MSFCPIGVVPKQLYEDTLIFRPLKGKTKRIFLPIHIHWKQDIENTHLYAKNAGHNCTFLNRHQIK